MEVVLSDCYKEKLFQFVGIMVILVGQVVQQAL